MPDRRPRPLGVLLRQPRCDTDLQRRLQVPARLLGRNMLTLRHPLHPRYQNPISKHLPPRHQ